MNSITHELTIKVCGMREADNIRAVEQLGVDWLGFIFWPKSSRHVSAKPAYLPTVCKRAGVFVDEDIRTVRQVADDYALDVIQLHGQETPDYVSTLASLLHRREGRGGAVSIVKAITIPNAPLSVCHDVIATSKAYEGLADYFLFDTKCKTVGGSGEHFDWTVLGAYDGHTPFLLSGGIGPDDAERILAFRHPRCVGIDLNSRFELSPGLKDVHQLREFIKKIRS